jgi:hypothetical protein
MNSNTIATGDSPAWLGGERALTTLTGYCVVEPAPLARWTLFAFAFFRDPRSTPRQCTAPPAAVVRKSKSTKSLPLPPPA